MAEERDTTRLEAFSDGVFAFAITLLVLDLKITGIGSAGSDRAVLRMLTDDAPAFVAFVLSFATILVMWINHHGIMKAVRQADAHLLFANGFLLMVVVLVPFTTALLGDTLGHPGERVGAAVYGGTFVLVNVGYAVLWHAIAHRRAELAPELEEDDVRTANRNLAAGFVCYSVATVAAWWNAWATVAICTALWGLWTWNAYQHHSHKEHEHA